MRPVFLIGFMGAGKTTVGRLVAARAGMGFVDLDEDVAAAEGATVGAIFESRGEAGFREAERDALAARAQDKDVIVACGGGIVSDEGSRSILGSAGTVVYLAVSQQEAIARIGSETGARPLLCSDPSAVAALLESRAPLYRATAAFTVDTCGLCAERVADRVSGLVGVPGA